MKMLAGGDCLRSLDFFRRCFLEMYFLHVWDAFNSYNSEVICSIFSKFGVLIEKRITNKTLLQLQGDLFNFYEIWSFDRKTYHRQNGVGEFDNSKKKFTESHFHATTLLFSFVLKNVL